MPQGYSCGMENQSKILKSSVRIRSISGVTDSGWMNRWRNRVSRFSWKFAGSTAHRSIQYATIRVSPDFVYTDRSDLDQDPILYYPGDFLIPDTGIDYDFTPHNCTITIQDGLAISMEKIYTP